MSDPRLAQNPPTKRVVPETPSGRTAYLMRGAFVGFAVGLGMLIATRGDVGVSAPWFLGAATIVGSVAGLDLYLSRKWKRFGRLTPMIRFTTACTGAAGLISAVSVLLDLIPLHVAWSFTALGAIGGLLYDLYLLATSA